MTEHDKTLLSLVGVDQSVGAGRTEVPFRDGKAMIVSWRSAIRFGDC